jgi:hypothetical protein
VTGTVARHGAPGPNAEPFAERLSEHLVKGIDGLEESADVIDSTFGTALLTLRARCVVDPRAAAVETWEAAVNAMQLGSALFAVKGVSEGSVECRINRKLRTIPAVGPLSTADAGNWLTAFWLAVFCRDQMRMTRRAFPATTSERTTRLTTARMTAGTARGAVVTTAPPSPGAVPVPQISCDRLVFGSCARHGAG